MIEGIGDLLLGGFMRIFGGDETNTEQDLWGPKFNQMLYERVSLQDQALMDVVAQSLRIHALSANAQMWPRWAYDQAMMELEFPEEATLTPAGLRLSQWIDGLEG